MAGRGEGSTLALVPTARLDAAVLAAAHALLESAFPDLDEHDWEHCLGGVHALLRHGADLIGHAALVPRRLVHDGRELRAGYVEGVAVRADVRRRGHGSALLAALEQVACGAYELGALNSTREGEALYAARGWLRWQGPTSVQMAHGLVRTPDDDGSVWVLPCGAALDLHGELGCDWRAGDVW